MYGNSHPRFNHWFPGWNVPVVILSHQSGMQPAIEWLLDMVTDLSVTQSEVQQWDIPSKAVINQTETQGTDLYLYKKCKWKHTQ